MYKDLIDKLRNESLYTDKCTLEIMDLCMEAARALEVMNKILDAAQYAIINMNENEV